MARKPPRKSNPKPPTLETNVEACVSRSAADVIARVAGARGMSPEALVEEILEQAARRKAAGKQRR